jgi:hypothetical protein
MPDHASQAGDAALDSEWGELKEGIERPHASFLSMPRRLRRKNGAQIDERRP